MKLFSQDKPITYKAWATTDYNRVFHFDGSSWSNVYTVPNPTWANGFSTCWAFSDNDFWCSFWHANDTTHSYVYHYTGTWTAYTITGTRIRSFWGTSSSNLWAFGKTDNAGAKIWRFDGSAWSNPYNPGTDQSWGHAFMWGSTANKIWIGRTFNYYNGWHNWEHGWNGSGWTEYTDTPGGTITPSPSIRFNPYDDKFYMWGSDGSGKNSIYTHSNAIDGSGWTLAHYNIQANGGANNNSLWTYQNKIWAGNQYYPSPAVWYYNGSSWSNVVPSSPAPNSIDCMDGHQENVWIGGLSSTNYAYVWARSPAGVWTTYNLGAGGTYGKVNGISLVPT